MIDEGAAAVADGPARRSIDAVSAVYWFAMDQPDAAMEAAKSLVLDELPPIVGAEMAWALASIHGDAGRTAEAVAVAEAGYEIAIRCSDAPHMRFNIADCACRRAGVGGPNQRGARGGGVGERPGRGLAGDGALAGAGDRGSGGVGCGSTG